MYSETKISATVLVNGGLKDAREFGMELLVEQSYSRNLMFGKQDKMSLPNIYETCYWTSLGDDSQILDASKIKQRKI